MGISNTIPPSRLIQPGVVANTAARPTSPFTGQAIYQTDTDEVLYYNGTSWSRPWNMPWGYVFNTTTTSQTITGGYVVGLNTTFTAVANRYYKITMKLPLAVSAGRVLGALEVDGISVARMFDANNANAAYDYGHEYGIHISTFTAGGHTLKITFSVISGACVMSNNAGNLATLSAEDIGPA